MSSWIDTLSSSAVAGRALLWIVLLPMAGALVNGVLGKNAPRRTVHAVAVGSVASAFVLACFAFLNLVLFRAGAGGEDAAISYHAYRWFELTLGSTNVPVDVRFTMDALSGVMTLVVTGIGTLIHIYSTGYMATEPSYARFFTYLNLFTASMLILVLGSNLPLMFVGWEGVGLCSYLLIGFWYENPAYAAAGRKAFVTNRIGDFGVLVGMFLLLAATQSFEFREINARAEVLSSPLQFGANVTYPFTIATAACIALFIGCAGKSAQIPLYVWLPDAMAGPTPVSALIHAATMVTAGVYLCCRLSPVFVQSPTAMMVIAVVGTLTALLAASIALVQTQLKKVLAYSTVSQLGFMFAAVGVGAFGAAFFHVFTHAFFKACMFLGAGAVMHAVGAHGDADFRELGGLKKHLPIVRLTFLVSCLAIAGFPLTSGFFSKDEILLGAALVPHLAGVGTEHFYPYPIVGWLVFGGLLTCALMTAFYMFRLYFMTFEGSYRGTVAPAGELALAAGHDAHGQHAHDDHAHGHDDHSHDDHAHEAHPVSPAMWVPLVVLAIGAAFVGFLGLPHAFHLPNVWMDWLEPALAVAGRPEEHGGAMPWIVMAAGTLAGLGGIFVAYSIYLGADGAPARNLAAQFPRLHALLMDKWRVDELYEAVVLRPIHFFGYALAGIDKAFVDGLLARATALVTSLAGRATARMQTGMLYTYGAITVVGLAALSWWFLLPHAVLTATADGQEVRYEVGPGLGYQYRWDTNGDGEFDTPWSGDTTSITHRVEPGDAVGATLIVVRESSVKKSAREFHVRPNEWLSLDGSDFRGSWARSENAERPMTVTFRHGKLVVRPGDAALQRGGEMPTEEFTLELGERVSVGNVAMLEVAVRARAVVEVRGPFGDAVSRDTIETVVRRSQPTQIGALELGGAR